MLVSNPLMKLMSLTLALALVGTSTAAAIPADVESTDVYIPEDIFPSSETSTQYPGPDDQIPTIDSSPNPSAVTKRQLTITGPIYGRQKCSGMTSFKTNHHRPPLKADCVELEQMYRKSNTPDHRVSATIKSHWTRQYATGTCQFLTRTSNIWGGIMGAYDAAEAIRESIEKFSDGDYTQAAGDMGCHTMQGDNWAKVQWIVGPR